jgi:acetyl-CoA carboxylase biotin carboxyl carrier protein
MNLKEIRELIEMIRGTEISEIEVEREGSRVRIQLGDRAARARGFQPTVAEVSGTGIETTLPGAAPESIVPDLIPGQMLVTAPMVGTLYRCPAPGEPPFVDVGTTVEKGQTLCIIEAMKLMNEIEAEEPGRVLRILKEDKAPVEYGEPLYVLEPIT